MQEEREEERKSSWRGVLELILKDDRNNEKKDSPGLEKYQKRPGSPCPVG